MGLSRLSNFLKSVRGEILYVDPNSLDSTDSIENQGNSLTRPFKTIQRALLEASRFSYQSGLNNDRFNKTTILVYPGDHIVDNRPGYIPTSTSGQYLERSSSIVYDFSSFNLSTNFDLTSENNSLYKLNSIHGGVIIPRGTSIVGMDLRKTKIRPTYVPNPENDQIERSCVFRVTGACYLWQFSILDADPNGICYNDYLSTLVVPNFSHHKLAGFEYADGTNPVSIADDFLTFVSDGRTDLDMYYDKVSIAYGQESGRAISPDYPSTSIDIQTAIDEYRIVGERGITVGISSIKAGNGVISSSTITLDFVESTNQFNVDTPIQVIGVGAVGYDGLYVVSNVVSSTQIQYQVQNPPANPLPNVTGSSISIAVDTVTSASPYIFNISLRSVWGMCGLLADGSKASGFKSMVVSQYTGIGLQKDDKAFVKYNAGSGTYDGLSSSITNIHSDSRARFKPAYENFHIKATNNAYLQLVSVFAIGFAQHFSVESGGDFSINNSNSNFGSKALVASGFRAESFPKDDVGYFTHIIPPKEIEESENSIDYFSLDVSKIVSAAATSRLYLYNETNLNVPPTGIIDGYRIGAKNNDTLNLQISQNGTTTEYSARITIPNNGIVLDENSSEKTFTVSKDSGGVNSISANIITLTSNHSFINGESIRIISDNAILPDGIDSNQIYYAITKDVAVGISSNQIQIAQSLNDAINNSPSTINSKGGVLSIVSRVSDKDPGDVGHPVVFDNIQGNWYVNVSSAATDNSIYSTIISLGVLNLGNATPRTYIKRKQDTRNIIDRVYRIRYVLPKSSPTTARPPLDGYVIQESNNTLGQGTDEIVKYFSTTTVSLSNSTDLRNPRFVANANWSGGTANIITELPHDLTVGSQVEVLNIISTNNTAGAANSAYNGTFTISGISSTKQFSYNLTNNPGTFSSNTSLRNSSLPRFNRKKLSGTYYIYKSQEIKKYIPSVQDGIYHLLVINSSNSPSVAPFTDLKFSQPLQNLYPQVNRDNPNSDPKSTKSYALSETIGKVVIDEVQNSITKETLEKNLFDFNVGIGITNIKSSSGIAHTVYTTLDHGLCGITSLSIVTGGSGYVTGTYYNARLTGSANGANATAKVIVGVSGTVTDVQIMDGGSAYVVGDTTSIVGVGTTGSGAVVQVASIYNNVGDCLSISGVSSAPYFGYNTLYKVVGITTTKEITVQSAETISGFSALGLGSIVTANANVLLTGRTLGISTFTFNSTTGVGIVTFASAHGFLVNNKLRIIGFNNSLYNGDYLVKKINSLTSININVGLGTNALSTIANASSYTHSLSSYGGDLDLNTENTSGRLISQYAGITTTLGSTFSATALETSPIIIPNAVVLGLNIGDYLQIDNEILRIKTTVTGNSIYAFRGLFGSPRQQHNVGSIVKRIKVLPVELRRNSIIRASGHTFEYIGFGPGNYSTALPEKQDRSLSDQEILLAHSIKSDGGISIYTGMDDKGNFFSGSKKINSTTGQEQIYDAPIPTVTGEDPTLGNNVGFDILSPLQISVNRSIRVEGGEDGNLLSEFDGPVVFNNKITSTSQKGLEVRSLFVQGDQTVSRKYTIGISAPILAGNPGDVVYNAFPTTGDYVGWIYTSNNVWEKFGKIGLSQVNSIGVSSNNSFVGISTLINFRTSGINLDSQYNSVTGITTLTFTGTGPQVTKIGVSTSASNTFAGVGTQINFTGTNIGVTARTDTVSGITTVSLVGIASTTIYRGLQFIKTDGGTTGGIPNILRVDGTESALVSGDILNALGFIPTSSTVSSNYPTGNSIVLDSIGSQFNGALTDFTMRYVGVAYTPFGSSANLIVSIGGVIQKPGLDFSIVTSGTSNTSTIRFTDAPTTGLSDFIVSLGGQGILLQDPAWDAKGDLIVGTGNDSAAKLPSSGTTDQVLSVDTTTSTGLKWRSLSIPAAQVQSDWNATSGLGTILNKPTIPAAQVQSSWTATTGLGAILNKPTIPAAQVQSDWNSVTGLGVILNKPTLFSGSYADLTNKPTIPAAQINSDWNATTGLGVILNKPSIGAAQVQSDWTAVTGLGVILNKPTLFSGSYTDLTNKPSIPAAQVQSSWTATTGLGVILNKPALFSGSYADLTNKPTIPAAQVQSDWTAVSGLGAILNKPTLATVATSGDYNNLSNKPTIPTVNNGTLTINASGTGLTGSGSFTANQSSNGTVTISSNATSSATANTLVSRDTNGSTTIHELFLSKQLTISDTTSTSGLIQSNGGTDALFDISNTSNNGSIKLNTLNATGTSRSVSVNYNGVNVPGNISAYNIYSNNKEDASIQYPTAVLQGDGNIVSYRGALFNDTTVYYTYGVKVGGEDAFTTETRLSSITISAQGGRNLNLSGNTVISFNHFIPYQPNTYTCGSGSNQWSAIYAVTGVVNTSDQREKTNITPSDLGLDFIQKLNPVSYKWIVGSNEVIRDEQGNQVGITSHPGKRTHYGLLAQEVKTAYEECGVEDFAGWVLLDTSDPDSQQALRYDQFISPLIKAVQEQQEMIDQLKTKNDENESTIDNLTAMVTALLERVELLENN